MSGWVSQLIEILFSSGLLAVIARYIKKSSGYSVFGKDFWTKEKYQEELKKEIERNTELYKELDYFRDTFDLKFIDITEFHNGDYINRRSIQKYTMTYQMCRLGIPETKHLYQGKPLDDHYGILNMYKESQSNVVVMDSDNIPDDAPIMMKEKMEQLGIQKYIALGLFAKKEDIYPRAIVSCAIDENSRAQGLEVELNLHEDKLKSLILISDV